MPYFHSVSKARYEYLSLYIYLKQIFLVMENAIIFITKQCSTDKPQKNLVILRKTISIYVNSCLLDGKQMLQTLGELVCLFLLQSKPIYSQNMKHQFFNSQYVSYKHVHKHKNLSRFIIYLLVKILKHIGT